MTEDSAADVHCRLLDRRRPPGLGRVRAGSGMRRHHGDAAQRDGGYPGRSG
ncbi:hypothetical protein GS506_12225 [Rhodococcus hoagii]|nr:hypothetical protein [Prescottella equi]